VVGLRFGYGLWYDRSWLPVREVGRVWKGKHAVAEDARFHSGTSVKPPGTQRSRTGTNNHTTMVMIIRYSLLLLLLSLARAFRVEMVSTK
jgi:hypothetical protein